MFKLNITKKKIVLLTVILLFQGLEITAGKGHRKSKKATQEKNCCPGNNDCRTYVFAFTLVRPRSMLKDFKLVGSRVELVKHICHLAGKKCETIPVEFDNCLLRERLPRSIGLNNGWFDVCVDVQNTPFESLSYRAPTFPFFKIPSIHGIIRKDSQLTPESLRTKGHILSLAYTGRLDSPIVKVIQGYRDAGYFVRDELVTKVSGPFNEASEEVLQLVENRTVDLGLMIPALADTTDMKSIFTLDNHDLGSVGMLVRRDDGCILSWFDHYHLKFICSRKYKTFCRDMVKKYGSPCYFDEDFPPGPPLSVHCVSKSDRQEWCKKSLVAVTDKTV